MKVVQINNYDVKGGAARACFGISKALNALGVDSRLLVQEKISVSDQVSSVSESWEGEFRKEFRSKLDTFLMYLLTKRERGKFSFANLGAKVYHHKLVKGSDIINLHWINSGLISLEDLGSILKLSKPVVWTLHDMWAFTGGCHYSAGCTNYLDSCGNCPALISPGKDDFSSKIWRRKREIFKNANVNIVTPSKWLAGEAKKSSLLKDKPICTIPYAIDVEVYKPKSKNEARKKLSLTRDKFLILFVAMTIKDKRKGFHLLMEVLRNICEDFPAYKERIELIILGKLNKSVINQIPFKSNLLGRLASDERIVDVYNASDVFVAPSLEDNLPNTVMEALSCGTPVTAFNVGGMSDMIDHKRNGYLAEPGSIEDFSNGVLWILQNQEHIEFSRFAREKVESSFTNEIVGNMYKEFYSGLLSQ